MQRLRQALVAVARVEIGHTPAVEVTTSDGQVHAVSEIRLTPGEAELLLRALQDSLTPDPEFEDARDEGQVVIQIAATP